MKPILDQMAVKENSITNRTNDQSIASIVFTNLSAAGADEYIVLYNSGNRAPNLLNWIINVDNNTINFLLPDFVLMPLESVDIHFGNGVTNSTDFFLNETNYVLNDQHGVIKLSDSIGNLVSEAKYWKLCFSKKWGMQKFSLW